MEQHLDHLGRGGNQASSHARSFASRPLSINPSRLNSSPPFAAILRRQARACFDTLFAGARFAGTLFSGNGLLSESGLRRLGAAGALAALALTPSAQDVVFTFGGNENGDEFSRSVSRAGDVNNDGFEDIVIGAPNAFTHASHSGQARVFSGENGVMLYNIRGETSFDFLGSAVGAAGDINADGYADFIVGTRGSDLGSLNAGQVQVFSGKTGSVLRNFLGDVAGDNMGQSACGISDIDGDGRDDILIGISGDDTQDNNAGAVRIYSGQTGRMLMQQFGQEANERFGTAVAPAGDINGDNVGDYMASGLNGHFGVVRLYSGKTGDLLYELQGDPTGDEFGTALAGAGDVDGDGFGDFLIGAPRSGLGAAEAGATFLYSGFDASLMRFYTGDEPGDRMGRSVAGMKDVDGDGLPDVAMGLPGSDDAGQDAGKAKVFKGKTGALIFEVDGFGNGDFFGWSVDLLSDINNDKAADLVAGAVLEDAGGVNRGAARIYSGKKVSLTLDVHEISLMDGGVQNLRIDMGPKHAGKSFWFAGSATGSAPGINTPVGVIPLNFDPYFAFSAVHPFTNPLKPGGIGFLDGSGCAELKFVLAPGSDPFFEGTTIHHAFGLMDPDTGLLTFFSNSVPVTLRL